MRYIQILLLFIFISCVPGATPPSERGGDSTPFIPPPAEDNSDPPVVLPGMTGAGAGVLNTNPPSNQANVITITPPTFSYTLSGAILVERVPFDSEGKLTYDTTIFEPLESAKAQLFDAQTRELVAETFVDNGNFNFLIDRRRIVFMRLIAESNSPKIMIKDNTNDDLPYQYDTDYFDLINGPIKNFVLNVGWNGSMFYANSNTGANEGDIDFLGGNIEDSFSAPFAILNHNYRTLEKVSSDAGTPALIKNKIANDQLDIYWSPNNKAAVGIIDQGQIGIAHYNPIKKSIYLKGELNVDVDEWDIYFQTELLMYYLFDKYIKTTLYSFNHSEVQTLQPGQLFPRTLAQVLTALLNDNQNVYFESGGVYGQTVNKTFDLNNNIIASRNWYAYEGQRKFIWDIFDQINEGIDYKSLSLSKLFDTIFDPSFYQDSAPINFYKFMHTLYENNPNDRIYLNHLSNYYFYKSIWTNTGPIANDTSLPSEFDDFNPLFSSFANRPLIDDDNIDDQDYTRLNVDKNNGICSLAGSEDYIRFYPISTQTRIELVRSDLTTIEILRKGVVIWASSNNINETITLETPDATIFGEITESSSYYVIRARSHPQAGSNNATVDVKFFTTGGHAPPENINNQFTLYSISFDSNKSVSVPPFVESCHPHPTIARYKFNSIPSANVRINMTFDNREPIHYKIILDGVVVVDTDTSDGRVTSHIFNYSDVVGLEKKMEIQLQNKTNLFRDQGLTFDLEYLPY